MMKQKIKETRHDCSINTLVAQYLYTRTAMVESVKRQSLAVNVMKCS